MQVKLTRELRGFSFKTSATTNQGDKPEILWDLESNLPGSYPVQLVATLLDLYFEDPGELVPVEDHRHHALLKPGRLQRKGTAPKINKDELLNFDKVVEALSKGVTAAATLAPAALPVPVPMETSLEEQTPHQRPAKKLKTQMANSLLESADDLLGPDDNFNSSLKNLLHEHITSRPVSSEKPSKSKPRVAGS